MHRLGVVHKDLRENNLLVVEGGGAKRLVLIDFGNGGLSSDASEHAGDRVELEGLFDRLKLRES